MASRLSCPGCQGSLEVVEASVASVAFVAEPEVKVHYLCHACGAHVTTMGTDASFDEVVEVHPRAGTVHDAAPVAQGLAARAAEVSLPTARRLDWDRTVSLTYLSTAVVVFDETDLRQLLGESRRSNHASGLTGMLLYDGVHFIQTLEGPADVVDETYRRIAADPRHRDLVVALREELDDRRFEQWSMGFDTLAPAEMEQVAGFDTYMTARAEHELTQHLLGRAGVFHRIFRDRMR